MSTLENMEQDTQVMLSKDKPFLWLNPNLTASSPALERLSLTKQDMLDAEARLQRFAPLLQVLFPELTASAGIIESDVIQTASMKDQLHQSENELIEGELWIKADHSLPVAGSIKARGGIYEVLCFAEDLALKEGLLNQESDYRSLAEPKARELFGKYTVSVGSTGNLGLSIGVMSAALGFKCCVHMSVEAKEWKKERLRKRGVEVVEHSEDYSKAVSAGREAALSNPYAYFVDDENSERLFLGYTVAALRLQKQLQAAGVVVDSQHPLFVYIPCGVGGAPGGVAFGLKQIYGDAVHCFFAEPTQAPCMLLGMATNFKNNPSVYDVGLQVNTEADGLAVSQPSELVGSLMKSLLSGIFTVDDDQMFKYLFHLKQSESIQIEPSAAAGFSGPDWLANSESGKQYIKQQGLENTMKSATHLVWTTGGRFVPEQEYQKFHERGKLLCSGKQD